jgi:hypothetical protein
MPASTSHNYININIYAIYSTPPPPPAFAQERDNNFMLLSYGWASQLPAKAVPT